MNDEEIISIFFESSKERLKGKYKSLLNDEITNYLENRFKDGISCPKEGLLRIKRNIEEAPICPICGNKCYFEGITLKRMYWKTCNKHRYDLSIKNTRNTKEKLYGDANYTNIHKRLETCKEKYGHTFNLLAVKQYWIDNYGIESNLSLKETKEKIKQTQFRNHDGKWFLGSKDRKKCDYSSFVEKMTATKRKNHTFNTSKPEEELYLYIKEKFPDVKRQYKEERYPYCCDFYVPSLDYFIELQGYYTHGKHPYDPNSKEDNLLIEEYKKKYGEKCQPITIWTIKDPEKRECAKKHNLNFKEVWSLKEGKEFIDTIFNKSIDS